MAFVTYTLSQRRADPHRYADRRGGYGSWIGNPELHGDELVWKSAEESADIDMLRPVSDPFLRDGGMRLVQGNLGRAIFKTSAVDQERWTIEAPARCFSDQNEVLEAFKAGELDRDMRGGRALPGTARQRHARAAQADADARRASGSRPSRRSDHRWPNVGRERQGSGRDPCFARSAAGRPAGPGSRRRLIRLMRAPVSSKRSASICLSPAGELAAAACGTGRELFALMRMHASEAEAGASAMLAAMEAEQA